MDLRKVYGGMAEELLNNAVDEHMDGQLIKEQLYLLVDKFVDDKLEAVKNAIKDGIEKIDGEKDRV